MKQLKEDIESINIELSSEIIDEINLVHKKIQTPHLKLIYKKNHKIKATIASIIIKIRTPLK